MIRGSRRWWRGRPATSSPTSRRRWRRWRTRRRGPSARRRSAVSRSRRMSGCRASGRATSISATRWSPCWAAWGRPARSSSSGCGAARATVRARKRIEAALRVARRAAARGEGVPTLPRASEPGVHVSINGAEAVLAPSPDMRRVRTSWLGPDGRPRAGRPAAAAKASAERARPAGQRAQAAAGRADRAARRARARAAARRADDRRAVGRALVLRTRCAPPPRAG